MYITSLLSSLHIHPINRGQTGFVNSSEELDKIGEGLEPKKNTQLKGKSSSKLLHFWGFHGANFPGCFLQIFGLFNGEKKNPIPSCSHMCMWQWRTRRTFSRVCVFFCLVLLREDPIPTLYLYRNAKCPRKMQRSIDKRRGLLPKRLEIFGVKLPGSTSSGDHRVNLWFPWRESVAWI